jgi:hypothetical protein
MRPRSMFPVVLAIFGSIMVMVALAVVNLPKETTRKQIQTPINVARSRRAAGKGGLPHESAGMGITGTAEDFNQQMDQDTESRAKNDDAEQEYHLVFSTGCSVYQDWQSYIFFFHALKSGQKGQVTRIASGCNEEDAEAIQKLHKEQIGIMSDRFHLHLTPNFSRIKPGLNFKYFNKPFGLKHWMENVLGFPSSPENVDAIIILMDPDQMLLRPFTNDFTGSSQIWVNTKDSPLDLGYKVQHGLPFAQQYGYGLQWKNKVNMAHVTGGKPSRVEGMNMNEASVHYAAGPPYIATAKDMYDIALTWCEFCVRMLVLVVDT